MNTLTTDVLVVGGGTGGTAAAIQAARQGVQTILVSETPWLGGMLTSAGVAAPDGNELAAFQTGLWGAFLRELWHRQTGGLDNSWVSMFSYDPRVGAKLFADWVQQLPNLKWIAGQIPLEVFQQDNCITGVRFSDFLVKAKVTLDATELGDLLALAEVPHRWGWELQSESGEPSAPVSPNELTQRYPVQAPTWVVILKDFGTHGNAPEISAPPHDSPEQFASAWEGYGVEQFLNYGRLPGGLLMINWPLHGNDYGEGVERLVESQSKRQEFLQESRWHTQSFARFIQAQLGRRYGLAEQLFPYSLLPTPVRLPFGRLRNRVSALSLPKGHVEAHSPFSGGAYALHPYYRESRRLKGLVTVREQDILPGSGGWVASLPGEDAIASIALGNYANDHHYPDINFPLQPKSLRWGGRWTGTPFTLPYGCLVPVSTDGLLVCEKNISVSHIANGSTRLQPIVMNIGQAAGMAAALCVSLGCQPRDLPVRHLQEALLQDTIAPAALIPLFNLLPNHPDWLYWQRYYLDNPEEYPISGTVDWRLATKNSSKTLDNPRTSSVGLDSTLSVRLSAHAEVTQHSVLLKGIFQRRDWQDYTLTLTEPVTHAEQTWTLITLHPEADEQLQACIDQQPLTVWGRLNKSGKWLVVEKLDFS